MLSKKIKKEVSRIIEGFEKFLSLVGYKCEKGLFNDENDLLFFLIESFFVLFV